MPQRINEDDEMMLRLKEFRERKRSASTKQLANTSGPKKVLTMLNNNLPKVTKQQQLTSAKPITLPVEKKTDLTSNLLFIRQRALCERAAIDSQFSALYAKSTEFMAQLTEDVVQARRQNINKLRMYFEELIHFYREKLDQLQYITEKIKSNNPILENEVFVTLCREVESQEDKINRFNLLTNHFQEFIHLKHEVTAIKSKLFDKIQLVDANNNMLLLHSI